MKIKLIISIFSIIITLFMLELFFRMFYPYISDYNTEMFRYAAELKRPSNIPGVSHEHIENSKAILMGKLHTINEYGLRGKNISFKKKSKKRILFLGDSITFGWGVSDNETFCEILEKKLNDTNIEILNFGIGNFNTEMEKNLFLNKGKDFDPDIVIMMYHINDIEDNPQTGKFGYWIKKNLYLYGFLYGKIVNIFSQFGKDYISYYRSLYTEERKNRLKNSFKELKEFCNSKNIPFFLFIIPEMHEFKNYKFKNEHEFIFDICKEQNITCFDILEEFKEFEPESLWISEDDVHPNSKGHLIIAEYIFEKLSLQIFRKFQ